MHEKLLGKPAGGTEIEPLGDPLMSRCVRLPAGLTEADLARLTAREIDLVIRRAGPVVGYASMIKLASGGAGTPPQTQFHAAKFLVEQAAALDAAAKAGPSAIDALRDLPQDELNDLIAKLMASGEVTDAEPLSE